MSGGFFRGTSAEQDTRFSNKTAKLLKTQKFAPELDQLVDMSKVKMDTIRPWIARRVTELLGFEDEVLINFIFGLLEGKDVDGKNIQIQLTGFMEKNTGKFMKELWGHLTSAQNSLSGIPQQFLDEKAEEARLQKAEEQRIISEVRKKEEDKRAAEQERIKKQDEAAINAELGSMKSRTSRSPLWQSRERSPRRQSRERSPDGIRPQTKNGLVAAKPSHSRSPNGSRSPSVSRSPRFRKGRRDRSLSRSPRRSPRRARRSRSPRRGRSPKIVRSPKRRRSPSYSRSPRRRSPAWSPPRYRRRSPRYARSPPRRSPIPSRRRQALSPSPRRRPQSPRRRISRSPQRRPLSPSLRRRPAPSPSPRRRPVPSLSPPRRHAVSPPRHPAPSLSPPRRHVVSPSPPRQQPPPPPPRRRSTPPPSPRQLPPRPVSLSPESGSRLLSPERPAIMSSPQVGACESVSPQKGSTMAHSGRSNATQRHRAAHSGREIGGLSPSPTRGPRNSSPSWHSKPTSSTRPRYSSPRRQGIVPASPVREASGHLNSSLRSSRGTAVHNQTPSPSLQRSRSVSDGSPPSRKRVSTSPKRGSSLSKDKFDSYKQSEEEEKNSRLGESRPQKRQRSPSRESSTSGERNVIAAHVARHTGGPDGLASTYSSDDQHRFNVENQRSSRDIGSDMDERNAVGSPSNSDERRKVSKKRRKEEKKMRKEEKRRKREERHKRKEEKRAAKAAAKAITSVTPPPDLDNRLVRTDEFDSAGEAQKSDEDDRESEQRRMENELRKKALDSIRARKAVSS